MKVEEFTTEIEKLCNFYEKPLTDEQNKIWYQNLKDIDIKRFRYIIGEVYKNYKYMPKLADILGFNKQIGQAKKEEEHTCPICRGTGYITYWKKVQNGDKELEYEYMAICKCGKQKQYKGWEIAQEGHRSNYYTPLAQELGL